MTTTITAGAGGTTHPITVLVPYSGVWGSRNIVHNLISGGIAVSIVAPNPRAGTFDLLYTDETDAWAAIELHRSPDTFTLTDTDRPAVGMVYVVDGELRIALDEQTQHVWTVTVGFQEIIPGALI